MNKSLRTGKKYTKGTIPTCIWQKNNHTTSKDYCGWHPTTKNLDILQRIIKAYTNENDLVLDCFMGSGSTAIACKLSNRDYMGCELDKEYISKAKKRINSYDRIPTLTQFLC